MTFRTRRRSGERGTMLLVVVFIAVAIAGLAAISSGRVVSEIRTQTVLEQETQALNSAYSQLHMAMNVVNNSAYNAQNQNLSIRGSVAGLFGGTVASSGVEAAVGFARTIGDEGLFPGGERTGYANKIVNNVGVLPDWLQDPEGVLHGLVENTNVRVYTGRDYIKRLQKLKGQTITDIDPLGASDSYFVLEAAGRSSDTVRVVSALVRENEPFSSFVFFQNKATLGVSGAPRGLIHSNDQVAFYFPDGNFVDTVGAVNGFDYLAGATQENTNLRDANPAAAPIALESVDFDDLKTQADLYTGTAGLDAEIKFYSDGKVRVREYTPPRYDMVEMSRTYEQWVGFHMEDYTALEQVQIGEQEVTWEEEEVDYHETETYYVMENVQVGETTETYYETVQVLVGTHTETRYRNVQVQTGTQQVLHSRQDPIWDTRTVTRTRWVQVWVPYNQGDAGGGTSVGGGGAGDLGEWQWVEEEYEAQEDYISGYDTVEWYEEEPVFETQQEAYDVTVNDYEDQQVERTRTVPIMEMQEVERTRQVPVMKTVTKSRMDPIYEEQEVTRERRVEEYETVTETWMEEQYFSPVRTATNYVYANNGTGTTMYIDGRINKLYGDLQGRLTIVGNDKVRVTGDIRYVDADGDTAMVNGSDYTESYERNSDYAGSSVLGVIAREDIVFTRQLPSQAEVNATLMTVNGRVGVDGFLTKPDGELVKDSSSNRNTYMTEEQRNVERAYDRVSSWKMRRFRKDSFRRIGGVISNNRIMETYIRSRNDGTSYVDAGFKRGNMKFDINLLFNPPPNFVEVPRPVATYYVPILLVRDSS